VADFVSKPCTAFDGHHRLANGPLGDVAMAVKSASQSGAKGPLLVFDDGTGEVIDLDLRGSKADILDRLAKRGGTAPDSAAPAEPAESNEGTARGRGRPKLGVVAREVTLLPRHWDWLATQPGGASVVLRRLVEDARRAGAEQDKARSGREAAYRFMVAMAGDLAGFEEATRALFAERYDDFAQHMMPWPKDVRKYALNLALAAEGNKVMPRPGGAS
jgi:hypothetical protein